MSNITAIESLRPVEVPVPPWFPPKAGDKLWMVDHTHIPKLAHVVSVFTHDDCERFVVAVWRVSLQRWTYDIVGPIEGGSKYWPHGEEHPDPAWRARIAVAKARTR